LENPVAVIAFTTEYNYLGSIVCHSLTSDAGADKRIRPASAAFGALKNILTNSNIDLIIKGRAPLALCLSMLLHGSKTRFFSFFFF
jgi:hypothetical protein